MSQQIGETVEAMLEDRQEVFNQIISKNRDRTQPYWVVMFMKQTKNHMNGKPVLAEVIKAYAQPPQCPQVGMITCKVDNVAGTFEWDVNMPQVPFDFDGLQAFGAVPTGDAVIETSSIAGAYLTQ